MPFNAQVLIDALDKIQMTHDDKGSWLVAEQALENSGAVFISGKWQVPTVPEKQFDCPGCIAPAHANHNSSCKKTKNASDDPALYAAELCGREAVTVEFAWEHLCDVTLYYFDAPAYEAGLDPWITINGLDRNTGKSSNIYTLEHGTTGEKSVNGDQRVFVSSRTLDRMTRNG